MTGKPRQPRGMRRSIANDRRLHSSATSEAEAVFDPVVPFSKKPNARYGPAVTVRSHEAKSLNLNRNYSAIHVPCSKHI